LRYFGQFRPYGKVHVYQREPREVYFYREEDKHILVYHLSLTRNQILMSEGKGDLLLQAIR
jgi:hypothetical protein